MNRKDIGFELWLAIKESSPTRWTWEQDEALAKAISLGIWGDLLAKAMQEIRPGATFVSCSERFQTLRRNFGFPAPAEGRSSRKQIKAVREENVRNYESDALQWMFKMADSSGRLEISQSVVANAIKCGKAIAGKAIKALVESGQISIVSKGSSNERSVVCVHEAEIAELGLGPICPIERIIPSFDAKRIAHLAKEIGSIQLSIKDGVLISSLFGRAPPKSTPVGVYDENVTEDILAEDLLSAIQKEK